MLLTGLHPCSTVQVGQARAAARTADTGNQDKREQLPAKTTKLPNPTLHTKHTNVSLEVFSLIEGWK